MRSLARLDELWPWRGDVSIPGSVQLHPLFPERDYKDPVSASSLLHMNTTSVVSLNPHRRRCAHRTGEILRGIAEQSGFLRVSSRDCSPKIVPSSPAHAHRRLPGVHPATIVRLLCASSSSRTGLHCFNRFSYINFH